MDVERKTVLIILDGLGDRRTASRNTPLESAKKPVMDEMAFKGVQGIHYPLRPGVPVGSGLSHTLLFGYEESDYPGRGVYEAFGAGYDLGPNDIAFRINFATVDSNFVVKDRRAGRREDFIHEMVEDLVDVLNKNPFGIEIIIDVYEGYRGVMILRGDFFSLVGDMDPQKEGKPIRFFKDNPTGNILNWIVMKSYEILNNHPLNKKREQLGIPKANVILIRGAGKVKNRQMFEEKYGIKGMGIADRNLYLGVARYFGLDVFKVEDEKKIDVLLKHKNEYDFFFVHFKLTDVYGHDGKWEEKKSYIEYVDSLLSPLLEEDFIVAITGDHSTPVVLKNHSGDPVPILIYGGDRDDSRYFGEYEAVKGRLGILSGKDVIYTLFNQAGNLLEVGK